MMQSIDLKDKYTGARPRDAGLTLVELLVVLLIITAIAALVAPRVMGYVGRSKTDVATAQLASIQTSLELYYLDMSRYPTEDEGLRVLVEPAEDGQPGWRGPYFRNESGLIDPWGNAYIYERAESGDGYVIGSLGRDNAPGGEGEDSDLSRS
ncbi:type II secretion system major pseudopilin GspG [Maricaulis sp.]|uniref:type II secretion system major pseudopilin GspG n=1 Tax=Maricaulis sp. TaxID=1486257 RepID=UPI001B185FC7|nr:type II secretion system major pseudopilin GspG [Maricaulis sp.]MBO6797775.1 type II secretion system major pseudopilin GspG [Maricaulis sp.]